jgi:hypothetical protein
MLRQFTPIFHNNFILFMYLCLIRLLLLDLFGGHIVYILQLTSRISCPRLQFFFHGVLFKSISHNNIGELVGPLSYGISKMSFCPRFVHSWLRLRLISTGLPILDSSLCIAVCATLTEYCEKTLHLPEYIESFS